MGRELTQGTRHENAAAFCYSNDFGDLLQQCYNIADTLIVGRFLGTDALAAVGSAFSLMTFLTAILLGLCHGQRHGFFHLLWAEG